MASAIIWNCLKSDRTETEKTFDYWVKKLYHDHKSRKGWGCWCLPTLEPMCQWTFSQIISTLTTPSHQIEENNSHWELNCSIEQCGVIEWEVAQDSVVLRASLYRWVLDVVPSITAAVRVFVHKIWPRGMSSFRRGGVFAPPSTLVSSTLSAILHLHICNHQSSSPYLPSSAISNRAECNFFSECLQSWVIWVISTFPRLICNLLLQTFLITHLLHTAQFS